MNDKQLSNNVEYEMIKLLIESVPLGCFLWDKHMNLLTCSEEALSILKANTKQEVLDGFYSFSPLHQPDGLLSTEKAAHFIKKAFQSGREIFEWTHKDSEGNLVPTEVTLVVIRLRNNDYAISYCRDVRVLRETIELKNRLEVLAFNDNLTGIHNRHYFIDQARQIFASRNNSTISIIMFDIDDFKKINDTHGHLAGDAVLREVSTTVQTSMRPSDLFARYGGEEFIVLIPESSKDVAVKLAERIRITIDSIRINYNNQLLHVTVSIGVSTQANGSETLGALINQADIALYRAKAHGKNVLIHA
ncbi:MAG: GGDEF domain-containing protein [Defluviitaleaceae bacterium]|nr:GGDEF domain-containing protein [Defluviitaleaceae bacterium]